MRSAIIRQYDNVNGWKVDKRDWAVEDPEAWQGLNNLIFNLFLYLRTLGMYHFLPNLSEKQV